MVVPGLAPGPGAYTQNRFPREVIITTPIVIDFTTNQTTYVANGVPLPIPASNRQLIMVLCTRTTGGTNGLVDNATVNGVPFQQIQSQGGGNRRIWLLEVPLPGATSGDFVWPFLNEQDAISAAIYMLYGAKSPRFQSSQNNDNPQTNTLDVPARGVALMGVQGNDTMSWSWSGLSQDVDNTIEAGVLARSTASAFFPTEQLGHVMTATPTASSANVSVAATWEPL